MITLQPIDETNMMEALALRVKPKQQEFVASPAGILARGYAHRRQRAVCWGIYEARRMVGLALLHDLEEEPACYRLMELLVNEPEQGKGIAYSALSYALDQAFREGKAERAYVDPHPENRKALALYASLGFLPAKRPTHLEPWDSTYFELNRTAWEARHGK